MANLLYRLGRFSARRAWLMVLGWLAALAVAAGSFLAFGGTLASSMTVPGTETERVTNLLADELPGLGGASGTVVFQTEDGSALNATQREQIAALMAELGKIDGVAGTIDPFAVAAERDAQEQQLQDATAQLDDGQAQLDAGQQQLDGAIAQAQAAGMFEQLKPQFAQQQAALDAKTAELGVARAKLKPATDLLRYASGLQTVSADGSTAIGVVSFKDDLFALSDEVTNAVLDKVTSTQIDGVRVDVSAEITTSLEGLMGPGEIIGVLIAALVLIVMLRALLPAMLPLVSSVVGVGVGVAGSLAFSGVVDMTSVTPVLGVMLGLAVGIDYSLFIINRHRRQLLAGAEVSESIALANGTSGNAVVFAGSTVLVALLALNVTGIPFLGVMGTVAAVCVLIAVLVAVSFTPALLSLLGMRVLNRRARTRIGHPEHTENALAPMNTGWAVVRALVAVVALLVIAVPALSMRLGLPDGSSEAQDSTQYRTFVTIADQFGAGQNGAILVVAELPDAVAEEDLMATQAEVAGTLMEQDNVSAVAPIGASGDRDFLAFQVVPEDGPSSQSTEELVGTLRALSPLDGDIELGVAGQASGNIDVSQKLQDVLPLYLGVVVGLSLIILILVFRSILVPLMATLGYVLSLFAAFGAITAVYQWGWLGELFGVHDPGPVLNFAPLLIMGVLFGLAMDYQLFLVSGMREAFVHGLPARTAVVAGLRSGRAVVTAAAIIMISVFGGFVFSHLAMIRPIGFGLAMGVLLDAFVVRMLLIPAVMHLVGNGAWWLPKWLDRILPNVDVEGAALERARPVRASR